MTTENVIDLAARRAARPPKPLPATGEDFTAPEFAAVLAQMEAQGARQISTILPDSASIKDLRDILEVANEAGWRISGFASDADDEVGGLMVSFELALAILPGGVE